jgi:hypothetical protein
MRAVSSSYPSSSLRPRQFVTQHSDVTSALVGIAGAFIGFHVSVILGLLPSPLMHYITAVIGALTGACPCRRGDWPLREGREGNRQEKSHIYKAAPH